MITSRYATLKYVPIFLLALAAVTFFYFHLYAYISIEAIKADEATIQAWTNAHYLAAVSLYILIYVLLIACGIPVATALSLIGGYLFGGIAVMYAIFSTTLGGIVLYFAVRSAIGARIAHASSGRIKKMEAGFQHHAFQYLLTLRLVPVFPCWISNIAAGALNVPLKTFISATILGIFPATLIYVILGCEINRII